MRKVPTKTPRRNKSRIAPGPLDIGTLRSCEGPTVFQLNLDPARLSFYCGFCKQIHEWVREFKEMECQMLRFDPDWLPPIGFPLASRTSVRPNNFSNFHCRTWVPIREALALGVVSSRMRVPTVLRRRSD